MNDKSVHFIAKFDKLSNQLKIIVFKNDTEMCELFRNLRVSCVSIASYAHEYDYQGVVGNGYWAGLKAVNRLLEVALFKWKRNPFVAIDFRVLLKYLFKVMKVMEELHLMAVAEGKSLFVANSQFTINSMDLYTKIAGAKAVEAMVRSFPGFTCPRSGRVAKTIYNIVAFRGIKSGAELMKWSFSSEQRIQSATQKLLTMDIFYFRKLFDSLNVKINSHLVVQNALLWGKPSICRTVYFDCQTKWEISIANVAERVSRVVSKSNHVIRCRLLIHAPVKSSSDEIPNGSLIIHFHGGAFSCSYPEDHEGYLRDWSLKLPGTAILVPDFSRCPEIKFPVFIQEILDLYLLVTSRNPGVGLTLGFRPNKVILSGDSSGGYMALVLTLVLNDIRLKKGIDPIESILMPKAILGLYPKVEINIKMSPSILLAPFDVFLTPVTLYNTITSVLPHKSHNGTNGKSSSWLSSGGHAKPWQQLTAEEKKCLIEAIEQFNSHPYMSPLSYEHFDTLKHVSLYLYPSGCCPLLDDSIGLANVWKGAVHLDILEDMIHCSFGMVKLSKQIQQASDRVVGKLKKALEEN